ncbi:group II intron reverse transcriptase/maturase [Pseudooceanicola nitratireducens]|uniref:reverse transcriptase domain-containing protein n=1 Tax=Pseudooceanicola nitratireducens TaxID=517719 RepID=UPI003103758D
MADTLYGEVRSQHNLFSAWRHVKRSALNSPNPKIKGEAAEFEHEHQKHLRRIQDQLREQRFHFDDVEGTLKDKKKREAAGKNPRPIAIATLQNRVVQRAILQVLQPRVAQDSRDINTRFSSKADPRLGKINKVNTSEYGVGGLMKPFGGVAPAIRKVMEAMEDGGTVFYQSDIKEFFTRIPTPPVIDLVEQETGDREFTELFAKGLEVNLTNAEELGTYRTLFPSGGKGVAQGSSLSAFAGNLLLYDLDHELNKMDVTAIRYIDDLFIVAKDDAALEVAIDLARRRLEDFGFELYDETKDPDKAARGECSASFDLLGCAVQPGRCVPSQRSMQNVKKHVDDVIKRSKNAISVSIASNQNLPPDLSFTGTMDGLRKHVYGWQKSFAFCTHVKEFRDLDRYVADKIADYQSWFIRKAGKSSRLTRAKLLGLPSMTAMFEEAQGRN